MSNSFQGPFLDLPSDALHSELVANVLHVDVLTLHFHERRADLAAPDVAIAAVNPGLQGLHLADVPRPDGSVKEEPAFHASLHDSGLLGLLQSAPP